MSDCARCSQDPCACLAPKSRHPSAVVRSTHLTIPWGITQQEFGLELFEAIKSVGGIQTLDEQILAHKYDAVKRAEAQTRRTNLLRQLKEQRDNLPVNQTLELVSRYPWVAHV